MIKCPKCQFEQPDDIYCAQCGVNMKTFVAPKRSPLQAFLNNQVLQIGVLFIGIVAFVIYDFSKDTKKPQTAVNSVAREVSRPVSASEAPPPPGTESVRLAAPAEDIPAPTAAQGTAQKISSRTRPTKRLSDNPNMDAPVGNGAAASPANPTAGAATVATSLVVSFYQASRNLINEIQREASADSISGEAFGGIVLKKRLQALKKSGELRPVSSNRYKLDGMPITLFKGLRTSDVAKGVGIYMQMTTLKNEQGVLQLEMKSWGHVKIQEPDESLFSSEISLDAQHSAFIAGFLPRDKAFTDEEKSLFESDRALKIYNQDDFLDGQTDLILFLEIPN